MRERVSDLEAMLEEKTERLEALEQDNRSLRNALAGCEDNLERFNQQLGSETDGDTASANGRGSLWNRAKRFVGDGKE